MSNMRLPARIVIDTERGEVRDMAGLKIGLVQNIDYRRESEIDHELGVVMKLRDELIVELRLPLFAQPPAPEPSVANPLHEATEIAKRNLPILLRDRGSQHEPSVDVEALCAHVSDHLLRNIDGGHYPENLDLALSAIRAFFGAEQPATQRDGFLSPTGGSASNPSPSSPGIAAVAGAVREGEAVTDSIRGWAAINKGAPMTDAPIRTAREALEAAAQEAERIDEMLPTATGIHDAIRALAARIPAEPTSTAQRARELGAVVATNRDSAYTQVTSAWLDAARDFLREIAGETP